jgi:hypothetical protein
MARNQKATGEVDKVRPYLEGVAKNLVDRIYGPDGLPWGTPLSELEDVVVSIREALSEKMLAQALERQAKTEQRPETFQKCPKCAKVLSPGNEAEPRQVQTRGGRADWEEPKTYCCTCRRSFFPSEQESGN